MTFSPYIQIPQQALPLPFPLPTSIQGVVNRPFIAPVRIPYRQISQDPFLVPLEGLLSKTFLHHPRTFANPDEQLRLTRQSLLLHPLPFPLPHQWDAITATLLHLESAEWRLSDQVCVIR